MPIEIERKFLVKDLSFKQNAEAVLYQQGYISFHPTVRVRVIGQKALLTVKGARTGISRPEYEYEIPIEDGTEMLHNLCRKPIIEKYRYKLEYEGLVWEIDEFLGENQGLIVAEIELDNEAQEFHKPAFIGDEVTYDKRYRNSSLVNHPYSSW